MNTHNKISFKNSILPLFCGIMLGIISLHWLIQHDDHLKKQLERQFKHLFYTNFNGIFSGTVKEFSIVPFSILFEDVHVQSNNSLDWSWSAKKFLLSFSWISTLINRKIDLSVTVQQVQSYSDIENNIPVIIDHLKRFIFNNTPVPIGLNNLNIKNATCSLVDKKKYINFIFSCNAYATMLHKLFTLNVYFHDTSFFHNQRKLLNELEGKLYCNLRTSGNLCPNVTLQAHTPSTILTNQLMSIDAYWTSNKGQLLIYNNDRSLNTTLHATTADNKGLNVAFNLTSPLIYLNQFIPCQLPLTINGTTSIQGTLKAHDSLSINGSMNINNLTFNEVPLADIQANFNYDNHTIRATLTAHKENVYTFLATASGNDTLQQGVITLSNESDLSLFNSWIIKAHKATMQAIIDKGMLKGTFSTTINHPTLDKSFIVKGSYGTLENKWELKGFINNDSFHLAIPAEGPLTFPTITYFDNNEKEVIKIEPNNNSQYAVRGYINYSIIQKIIQWYGLKLNGTGIINLHASLDPHQNLETVFTLHNASILIPGYYNHIQNAQAQFCIDWHQKKLNINNMYIAFNKGSLACKQATIQADQNGNPDYIFFPLMIDNILINKDKNFFAVLTGNTLFTAKQNNSSLSGNLVIERCQFKQNIFSTNIQQYFAPVHGGISQKFHKEIDLDLQIQTKNPLHVKTPLLEISAGIHATLRGTAESPQLSGTIQLSNGAINFPYKPLMITSGSMIFIPGQLNDPLINVTAQSKIRNYQVTMHINGSAQTPHITLESTPSLSEEQIITLLLAGNEEGALALAMPSLAVNQLQQVLFSSDSEESTLERYFKHILGPLRHIRFIPRFADQTARGGFRGMIQVDVSDKLRAVIQKNFSLTEDTKLEVEYYATDDLTLRGIRDERGDLGGELEMRLKF